MSGLARSEAPARAPGMPLWRRVLPFALAALLVVFVLSRLDIGEFVRAVRTTNYLGFFGFTVLFTLALLSTDSLATAHVYRRTVCPVRYREVFVIRGASYLPSMLNHHVGQGWLTYFISKRYGAPLWRVACATLLVYATTFGCVFLLGAAALPFNHGRIKWLAPTIGGIAIAGFLYMIVVHLRPAFLKHRQATAPLVEVGVRGHLLALAWRVPHIFILFLGTWIPFTFFDVNVPFVDALAFIPVVMLVTALPITPQGVGTRDVVAVQLLASYAPGNHQQQLAAVAAATLSWACAITIVQAIVSPLFMRRAQRMLGAGTNRDLTPPAVE
jgi:uncharacterized membrane protein YbhN (UPF0104 family)